MYKNSVKLYLEKRIAIAVIFLAVQFTAIAQEPGLQQQFTSYAEQAFQEKLYIHTDKNFYLAGEICWFKIYNTDALFNKPLGISKIAYIEVLDKNNKPVLQAKSALNDGDGDGSLQLPLSLPSGKYLFRAYTRWMKNFNEAYFFEKPITIINARRIYVDSSRLPKDKYDIQFFPEGGNLVNGIESKIAFRAVDYNGNSIFCAGAVINDKNDTITRFASKKFGMGNFMLTPEQGHSYRAVITLPDGNHIIWGMPQVYDNGYVMHLEKINQQLKVTVRSSDASSTPVYLFVHTRGSVKAVETASLQNGAATFLVDTSRLGAGISQFTIFNAARKPVCERLFFKKPVQHLEITAATDMPSYELRKKVTISVSSADQAGALLPADMSMAVYRTDSLTAPDDMDINSYLWLSSDLTGKIESPSWYFSNQSAEADETADNLMLTQGWRRFRWDDVLQNKKPLFEFAPEYKGHIVSGKVVNNANGQPETNIETFLSVAGTRSQFRGAFSGDDGTVKFEMNHFYGNNEIIVQTTGQDKIARHVDIESPFANKFAATKLPSFYLPDNNAADLLNRNIALQVQNNYTGNQMKQMFLPAIDTTAFYVKPDETYLLDDYVRFTTVEEILREYVPGVNVRRRDGKYFLPVFDNIRKEYFVVDPLILLDGVPVLDADKIMSYDPLKIRKLEVVARMYFYGSMYFGGIINFITYHGDLPGYELDPHATVIDYETLQMEREFFSPLYETTDQYQARLPDFRNLLYWNPAVTTGKDGKKEISFYTSDVPGQYTAVLQGLAADGKAGSRAIFFQVNEKDPVADKK